MIFSSNRFLVADAAAAIRNGFGAVFGPVTNIMCWFHMKKCVEKRLNELQMGLTKTMKTEVLKDIERLQLAWSPDAFSKASLLLKKKWQDQGVSEAFLSYMEQWLTDLPTWYEGMAKRVPSTNNALEAFNNVIKKKATFRKRLPLGRFVNVLKESVRKWSTTMVFTDVPVITQKMWLDSYRFAKEGRDMEQGDSIDDKIPILCAAKGQKLTKKHKAGMNIKKWKSFDRFLEASNIYELSFVNNDNWHQSTCTCPSYFKLYLCKHIIGLAILKKLALVPRHIKSVKIGQKIKAGRPAKAKKALQRNY